MLRLKERFRYTYIKFLKEEYVMATLKITKDNFQKEGFPSRLAADGACNHIHTGTVVISCADKHRQHYNHDRSDKRAQILVFKKLFHAMLTKMNGCAKQDADQSAEHGGNGNFTQQKRINICKHNPVKMHR